MEVSCISPELDNLTPQVLKDLVLSNSAQMIVFPEYLLELVDVPEIQTDKLIVWGSKVQNSQNQVFVQVDNQILTHSKIYLTPWEQDLKAGSQVLTLEYKGVNIAILICFDIEFPELSVQLKSKNIDIIIVPAATETILGYERISRCASARSVELGCAVVTSHLIGKTQNPLIDINVGNHCFFLPSQSLFLETERETDLPLKENAPHIQNYQIDIEKIRAQRFITDETNPSLKSSKV